MNEMLISFFSGSETWFAPAVEKHVSNPYFWAPFHKRERRKYYFYEIIFLGPISQKRAEFILLFNNDDHNCMHWPEAACMVQWGGGDGGGGVGGGGGGGDHVDHAGYGARPFSVPAQLRQPGTHAHTRAHTARERERERETACARACVRNV